MAYYKQVTDGYVVAVGTTTDSKANCTQAEYDAVQAAILSRPAAQDGFACRLKTDLTWETCELPAVTVWTQSVLESMTNRQLSEILVQMGISAYMTKENMVQLILMAQ